MQVLIMRHGEAALEAVSDSLRELTNQGRTESRNMAAWLAAQHVRVKQVWVSPYLRAQQTLEVVGEVLLLPEDLQTQPTLTPSGNASQIADKLRMLANTGCDCVLIISHLPLVGYLVAALCPQWKPPMFTPSQICCITLQSQAVNGEFNWQMNPGKLPVS